MPRYRQIKMNQLLNIKLPEKAKIAVIGDIHGHDQQFFEMVEKIKPDKNRIIISVGDIKDKGFGKKAETKIINKIQELTKEQIGYIIRGNHEMWHINQAKKSNQYSEEINWFMTLPFALSFVWPNENRVTVVHGGVTPHHTWKDLENNTDLVYIRTLNDKGEYIPLKWVEENGKKVLKAKGAGAVWHETYDGRFGYIASGHNAQKDGIPKFYKYSCNLDSSVYSTGILTAQIFERGGLEEMIRVTGPAGSPGFDPTQR